MRDDLVERTPWDGQSLARTSIVRPNSIEPLLFIKLGRLPWAAGSCGSAYFGGVRILSGTIESPRSPFTYSPARPRRRRRALWVLVAVLLATAVALVTGVLVWSGVSLAADATALARVEVRAVRREARARAGVRAGRATIPLVVRGGSLTPRTPLTPGENVSVDVVVRRPGWLAWALGSEHRERLDVRAPRRPREERWLTVRPGLAGARELRSAGERGRLREPRAPEARSLDGARSSVVLPSRALPPARSRSPRRRVRGSGSAPRSRCQLVPALARPPVAVSQPAPGTPLAPAAPIRLTFSKPVDQRARRARGRSSRRSTSGRWRQTDSHTLVFVPSGFGARFATDLRVELPRVGRRGRTSRAAGCERPASIALDGAARLGPAPPAAPRPGRLPTARLDAGRRAGRAHAARRAAGRRRPAEGPLQLALSEHAAASCARSGARAARTRSPAAP